MKHHKRHVHDWQWSEERGYYLCPCGATLLSEEQHQGFYYATPAGTPAHILGDPDMSQETLDVLSRMIDAAARMVDKAEPLKQIRCWSCLGSGYSDYAIGQPCEVCGGLGYRETI